MTDISIDLIKRLRQETQVSMMDCKKALIDAHGDYAKAIENLRKKGASVAAKRADNATNNGTIRVTIAPDYRSGSIVEVGCETDFSANTDDMRNFAQAVANHVLATDVEKLIHEHGDNLVGGLMPQQLFDHAGLTVQDKLDELISKISESIKVSRFAKLASSNGVVNAYVHPGSKPVGILVLLEVDGPRPADITSLVHAAKDVCMQIAVTNPQCINPEELPAATLASERDIYAEQLRAQGKPEQMVAKIVEGKMQKFYETACLHHQRFIKDDKMTIAQMLDQAGAAAGCKVRVRKFIRLAVGS